MPALGKLRQFVNHGHILVNGIKTDIPSFQVSSGDEIGVREKTSSRQLATRNLEGSQYHPSPPWLEINVDSLRERLVENLNLMS